MFIFTLTFNDRFGSIRIKSHYLSFLFPFQEFLKILRILKISLEMEMIFWGFVF